MTQSLSILVIVFGIILVLPSLCRKIHIPSIVGFIVAGMVVGPYGFQWLQDDVIAEIGQLGMLYIMFQSGSEIDLNDFITNKWKCLYFGLLSFVFPFAIGFSLCYWWLSYSLWASALLGAMLGSHTLMTYPIVSRYGIQEHNTVNIVVGGTIFTIAFSLLGLAWIETAYDRHEGDMLVWLVLAVKIVLFFSVVYFVFPWVVQQVFKKSATVITHFLLILFLIVAASYLASLAKLEGIFGAFICGVALNKLIPNRSALMSRINFMGNSIFVPLFLIGVGMMIDIRIFLESWNVVILASVMIGSKAIGKWLAAWVTEKSFSLQRIDRQLIFGMTHATAASTLAIATVGYNIGLFSPEVLSAIIILILVLCTLSSFTTEYAAKRIALQSEVQWENNRNTDAWMLMTIGEKKYESLQEIATLASLLDTEIVVRDNWHMALDKAENSNKSILIYHEEQPINTIDRVLVAVPQYAEKEKDFITCFGLLRRLTGQIGAKVTFYCWPETEKIIRVL
ncbi:MAG: cation:proton antiporter, partial [Paludibacteraceae bacterium]|nr:cation:proton antiporter [Paludibacteraceae bacterium]